MCPCHTMCVSILYDKHSTKSSCRHQEMALDVGAVNNSEGPTDLGLMARKHHSPIYILGVAQAGSPEQQRSLRQGHGLLLWGEGGRQHQVTGEGVQRSIWLLTPHLSLQHICCLFDTASTLPSAGQQGEYMSSRPQQADAPPGCYATSAKRMAC